MSDMAAGETIERIRQLSGAYRTQRLASLVITGVGAAVAILSVAGMAFYAWSSHSPATGLPQSIQESVNAEIASRTERLTQEIQTANGQIAELKRQVADLRTSLLQKGDLKVVEGRVMTCPDGYYVKGWTFQDQAGLAHGALWGPSAICGQLNVGKAVSP